MSKRKQSTKQRNNTIAMNDSIRVSQIKKVSEETTQKANPTKLFVLDIHSAESEGNYEEWIALIKSHATANYGEIVQEISRIESLPDPAEVGQPAGTANRVVIAKYSIDYKARQDIIKERKDLRSKLIGFLQTWCSIIINNEVEEVIPDYRTNPNIPAFIKAIRNAYKQSSVLTDNFSQNALKIKYAEFLHPFIWTKSYNIFKHHQQYVDLLKEHDIVQLHKPSDSQQAIDFLYSLSPEFTAMQVELRNNENRVKAMPSTTELQVNLKEAADIMPKTLSTAFKYARQYVGASTMLRNATDNDNNISNANYTANQQRRKGNVKENKKSPAKSRSRSPSPQSRRDDSSSDSDQKKKHKKSKHDKYKNVKSHEKYCDICDKDNHNTCECYRLKPLIKKYKTAFLEKNNAKKSSSKTSNANYGSHSDDDNSNDDDDGEGYHYTRMVNTNELYQDNTYDSYHSILDNGANITIIKDEQLVTNIRSAHHNNNVITMSGVTKYKWEADSIFGTVLYDPTAPYNIISQSYIERLYEHTAIKDHQLITVQHDVRIQSLGVILHFKLDKQNMLTCNLKCLTKMPMIIPKKPVAKIPAFIPVKIPAKTDIPENDNRKQVIKKVCFKEVTTHNISDMSNAVQAVPSPTTVVKVGVHDHTYVDSITILHNNTYNDADIDITSYDDVTSLHTEPSHIVEYT